jgi:hypothetical protein
VTHDVFICHSSKDRTIADAIVSMLEQHRIRCWIAPRDVLPGMEYAGAIVEAISSSKLTVLVFSSNSNQSPHVRREIERTVSRGIAVLPFRVEDVVPSPSLEYFISDAHWLDAMTPPLEQHLDHLVGTVRRLLERDATGAASASAAAAAPGSPPATAPPPPPPLAVGSYPAGPRHRPAWQWATLGAGGVAAVVLTGLIVLPRPSGPVAIATTPPPTTIATPTSLPTPAGTPTAPPPTSVPSVNPTDNPADDFVDQFDGTILTGWSWVNEDPARWNLTRQYGWLTIYAPKRPPLTNVLLYEPEAERFTTTTRLRFRPTSEYQFAGLVLTGEDPNADRLEFGWAYCEGQGCLGEGLYFDRIVAGEVPAGGSRATALEGSPTELYLALDASDGIDYPGEYRVVNATYSYDGVEWFSGGFFPFDDAYTRVGLIVLDADDEIGALFEYVYVARFLE